VVLARFFRGCGTHCTFYQEEINQLMESVIGIRSGISVEAYDLGLVSTKIQPQLDKRTNLGSYIADKAQKNGSVTNVDICIHAQAKLQDGCDENEEVRVDIDEIDD